MTKKMSRQTTVQKTTDHHTRHQNRTRVGKGERKNRCKTLTGQQKPQRGCTLNLSCGCKQKQKNPPNKPRHWRNGLGLLGGVRPIAGTNGSNDDRGEGHNESRTPLQLCTGVFQGRLPAGDGRPGTHQCTAGGGSGSIAAGRTGECSCPNLREKDARCKRTTQQEAGKPRTKHRKKKHREIARRRKNQNPETERQPLGQEEKKYQKRPATRPKQQSPKIPEKKP